MYREIQVRQSCAACCGVGSSRIADPTPPRQNKPASKKTYNSTSPVYDNTDPAPATKRVKRTEPAKPFFLFVYVDAFFAKIPPRAIKIVAGLSGVFAFVYSLSHGHQWPEALLWGLGGLLAFAILRVLLVVAAKVVVFACYLALIGGAFWGLYKIIVNTISSLQAS